MNADKIEIEIDSLQEFEEFEKVVKNIDDPVLLILKVHLYTEHFLERFISCQLPRGDRLLEDGNLTYKQKLSLAASFDFIPDPYISSLKHLNRIRNQCVHELHKEINISEIDRIGRPLGQKYTQIKREHMRNTYTLLMYLLIYLCGGLSVFVESVENNANE